MNDNGLIGYNDPAGNGCRHFNNCFECPFMECIASERGYQTHRNNPHKKYFTEEEKAQADRIYKKKYLEKHKEEIKAYQKAYHKEYAKAHREEYRERNRLYRLRKKERELVVI